MRFLKLFLLVFSFAAFLSSCNKFGKVLKSKNYEYKESEADKLYNEKKYSQAQQLYEQLYPVYKGTDRFEEIYYKDAYCFFYLKEYKSAEDFFKGFLEVFPNSTKAEEVGFMQAYCYYKESPKVELDQTTTIKTIGMMQAFINVHPGSEKIQEANKIIDDCRSKLELKEFHSAELYFKIGQFRAAALGYENVLNDYPESTRGEEYELKIVESYYELAKLSVPDKQEERFEKVTTEYQDFSDRYPDSKLLKEAESYSNLSKNNIKEIKNEQTKTTIKR